ncbi:MAG: O-antigen ligase family protein [Alphaproteobacteria bacterium]|nr:O-antigen ligase family protein [Alphaproteobacteria bacterium]
MTAEEPAPHPTKQGAWFVTLAAVALAVAFQIQATPKLAGSAIRISVADLISPIVFVALAVALVRRRLHWPQWTLPRLWLWLGLLSAVLAMALVVGRVKFGIWLPWAVVNKFGGWFALVWYLVVGGLVSGALGADGKDRFLKVFLIFLWATCALSVIGFVLFQANVSLPIWLRYERAEGFMQNPNAFGVLVTVAIAAQFPFARAGALFGPWVHRAGLALALTALVLTGSRSAWLGFLLAAPLLAVTRMVPWRDLGIAAASAAMVLGVVLFGTPALMKERHANYQSVAGGYVLNEPMFSGSDRGLLYRYRTGLMALDLWQREPILGAGLGGFPHHLVKTGHVAEVIHSTYLWILTEMGAVGFIAFAVFFAAVLRALWRQKASGHDPRLAITGMAVMLTFAGAAIGMEAMYQRHLWFILGLVLALPAPRSAMVSARE